MFENLTDVFSAVAVKYLTAVDADPSSSNQHEIGGLVKAGLADAMGYPSDGDKIPFPATMVFLDDFSDEPIVCEDVVTWYDSRHSKSHRGPEYRLYYRTNSVTDAFQEGDFSLVAFTIDRSLLMIFCRPDSAMERQLRILFGATQTNIEASFKRVPIETLDVITPIRLMLARYGVELDVAGTSDAERLEIIREEFGDSFPSTKKFSNFTRNFASDVSATQDPDMCLIRWMDEEELMFRLLERHIVQEKLTQGFGENGDDVDEFISFSLSVQNRRKSRVGHAFENHIEELLIQNGIRFQRGVTTEGKQKPDFLFPGQKEYHDSAYPSAELRMLAAKTTCKERWRQILPEAKLIDRKHLITLEPSISSDQTAQMIEHNVQLIVPLSIQSTYSSNQREYIFSIGDFVAELRGI